MRIANDLVDQIQKRRKSLTAVAVQETRQSGWMGGEGEAENSTSAATMHPGKKEEEKLKKCMCMGGGVGGRDKNAHAGGKQKQQQKLSIKKYLVVLIYPTGRAED